MALQVLVGVQVRSAYSDKLEDTLAEKFGIERRDRAFLNELIKGTLKQRGTIDAIVTPYVHIGFEKLPPWIQNALRLGAYQILYLDRVPIHAAVSESVTLAQKYGHPGTAGLVNSVLRRLAENDPESHFAELENIPDPLDRLVATTSHPKWLLERWLSRFSQEDVQALTRANNRTAVLHLRVNRLQLDTKELIKRLERYNLVGTVGQWTESSVGVEGEVDFSELDLIEKGVCTVQDESETLVGFLVSPKPGQRVLDFCAAPGGKTTHMAELMGDQGELVAVEKQPSRARILESNLQRSSLKSVQVIEGDATDQSWEEPFHRVLVDAPCSGLGVLARRADARWRKKPEIVQRMATVQRELLEAARHQVRRGGALVYSVCSFEPEETLEIAEWFLAENPDFRIVSAKGYVPDRVVSDFGALLCLPHVHGTDGVFAVRFEHTEDYVKPS